MDVDKAIRAWILALALPGFGLSALYVDAANTHYRWQDERGNVVHSDRPPPAGIDYEVITTGSSKFRKVEASEGAVPPETQPRAGNEFEQVDSKPKVIEKNPEYCRRAQENLEAINTRPRVRMRNEQGEYYFLDEEQIAEQKRLAQENIDLYCE